MGTALAKWLVLVGLAVLVFGCVAPKAPDVEAPAGQLVFSRVVRISDDPSPHGTAHHIFVADIDGYGAVDLTPDLAGNSMGPAYAPEGDRITFFSETADSCYALFVMAADGTDQRRLSEACYMFTSGPLIWSRDGKRVAFYYPGDFNYHVFPVEGGEMETLADLALAEWALPDYSPDGRHRVGFCPNDEIESPVIHNLCLFSNSGNVEAQLTQDPLVVEYPRFSWSPDGNYVAFTSGGYIYIIDREGTELWKIAEGFYPSWQLTGYDQQPAQNAVK